MLARVLSHIEAELKGKTLLLYWRFLRQGSESIGTRAIQRDQNLSSPSVAFHHLEKLRRLGLLNKNQVGEYRLVGEVKIGLLSFLLDGAASCYLATSFTLLCSPACS